MAQIHRYRDGAVEPVGVPVEVLNGLRVAVKAGAYVVLMPDDKGRWVIVTAEC